MKIKLKDIIDLDYFIRMDDALESMEDVNSRVIKDRKMYHGCRKNTQNHTELLLSWLILRKEEFFAKTGRKDRPLLPGTLFSFLHTWMMYSAILSGGILGVSLAYSFLAYHGTSPINVAVFMAVFIVFQFLLILFTLIVVIRRAIGAATRRNQDQTSVIHTVLIFIFFNFLPRCLKKAGGTIAKKNRTTLEYTSSLIRRKNREYSRLFFWTFFILASVFAFSFSTGAVSGTFFRVIVSDMAFGWQSTLMATSEGVHDIISLIALPWSWFMPESVAVPSLEQVEGSRIVLKDGISVLATQDLVSWWPFLCMGILFYAILPRGALIIAGLLAHHHGLQQFDFKRPRFKRLIARMQSPVVDINADGTQEAQSPAAQHPSSRAMEKQGSFEATLDIAGQTALVLASNTVYSDAAMAKVISHINRHLFFDVKEMIAIQFDFDADSDAVCRIKTSTADQVILLHEVWQPPIRGVLYYITQIKAVLPEDRPLKILLTQDAGQEDLSVDASDLNFDVWKKAIVKLEDPFISVERFL